MRIELIQAIRAGDSMRVRELLSAGVDPNIQLPAESDHGAFLDEVTPLMVAVAAPNFTAEIVKMLLAHGSDPFAVSAGEMSPTWYACLKPARISQSRTGSARPLSTMLSLI